MPGLIYTSPYTFTRWQRIQLAILPRLIAWTMKLLFRTCSWETRNRECFEGAIERYGHVLLALWHESMGLGAYQYEGRNFHTTTSYSFDGELAARVIHLFNHEAVRGSSSRGGSEALEQMAKAALLVPCVGITLDGPRGPRRQAKAGIAILAARTKLPIVPVAFAVSRCWRLRSWDRFPVPKPFARVCCAYAPVMPPPEDDSPERIEPVRVEVERVLNALHASIEDAEGNYRG